MSNFVWKLASGFVAVAFVFRASVESCCDDGLNRLVARIKAVGNEGAGNGAASAAIRELSQRGPESLIDLLRAMDDTDPVPANWLRGAVDAIAERAVQADQPLPAADLEKFALDRSHAGPVRRLAFEWLTKVDPTAPDRLIPGMLDDPAAELRRDAVARAMNEAKLLVDKDDPPAAVAAHQKVLARARDRDQVLEIAKRLESLGQAVDLTRHFGCIQHWHLIAPFDNSDTIGFRLGYPPEKTIDPNAEYEGKEEKIRWTEYTTDDRFGMVDLNKVIGKHMGAVAYAFTEVNSREQLPVEIRVGTPNAIKIWLNGKLVFTRDEYHHGTSMDQYQATGKLQVGRNTILIKVCQNEQKDDWAQNWMFQARLCDLTGGGILHAGAQGSADDSKADKKAETKDTRRKTKVEK